MDCTWGRIGKDQKEGPYLDENVPLLRCLVISKVSSWYSEQEHCAATALSSGSVSSFLSSCGTLLGDLMVKGGPVFCTYLHDSEQW